MTKIRIPSIGHLRRPLVCLASVVLLFAFPAAAANVVIAKGVREKTATLGVPTEGVSVVSVAQPKVAVDQRAAMKQRANTLFANSPAAAKVKSMTPQEVDGEQAVIFKAGTIELEISKAAGAEALMDLSRYTMGGPPKRVVDERSLETIARKYIADNMPDVNPNEVGFSGVKKIMDSSAKVADDGTLSEQKSVVSNYVILFQRTMNGVPFVGPGESIRVYLTSSAEVIGHSMVWRQVDSAATKAAPRRVVPPDQIINAARQKLARHPAPSAEIDFIQFGYWAEGRYTKQSTFSPVYLIGYTAGAETKRVIEAYDAYTGALIPPPADPTDVTQK